MFWLARKAPTHWHKLAVYLCQKGSIVLFEVVMTAELVEVIMGAAPRKREEMIAWAVETFGNKVEPHDSLPILYFHNLADAQWFVMRWT